MAAPLVLAATTLAGVAGAVLALLPAALRRRPAGRLAPGRGPGLRSALPRDDTGGDEGSPQEPASEPLTP